MATSSDSRDVAHQASQGFADTEQLEAAVEAGESPLDGGASGSSDDGSSSAPTRQPKKNAFRERMKAEMSYLRARVQDLERELSQTLAKKALERCATSPPAWRDLAKRQAARREKSEQERDRLRARLLHQLQVAKSLETIFRNRSGAFIDDLCANASAKGHKEYPVDNLAQLHDQFMDEIDGLFPLVDTMFTDHVEPPLAVNSPQPQSTVVSEQSIGDEEKLYIELRNAAYAPFPFKRVCSAMWRAMTTEFTREGRLVERYCCTDDEYSGTFISQKSIPGHDHNYLASMVMRKFEKEHQTVFLWRSVNWDRACGMPRLYGDETGWVSVESTSDGAGIGTIVRVCTRFVPIIEVPTSLVESGTLRGAHVLSDQSFQVGEVTNRVLNRTEEDLVAITESIENILLDESIGTADDDLAALLDGSLGTGDDDLAAILDELETLTDNRRGFDTTDGNR